MTTDINETCKKLLDRNSEHAWVWSMLLSQDLLNWDNVWDAFPDGVLTNTRFVTKARAVQSTHMLLSLPDAPKNIVDVFQRLEQITKVYPYKGYTSYEILSKWDLSNAFIQATHGFVQCTWPQVKAVLDSTKAGGAQVGNNLRALFDNLLNDSPAILDKSLLYMMEEQHSFLEEPAFTTLVHARGNGIETKLWEKAKNQQWEDAETLVSFLAAYSLSGQYENMTIPAMEALAFLEKHPAMLESLARSIVSYGQRHPTDDVYFEYAKQLLANDRGHTMELTVGMQRSISLDALQNTWSAEQKGAPELKPLLLAYMQMDPEVRDTRDAAIEFSKLFCRVQVHLEGYLNGHSNELLTKITRDHPTGTVSRILALHACIVGLYPDKHSDNAIKQLKTMFKHDPRSNTGFNSIIKKVIPEMKAWLNVAESIGLCAEDIWSQGLQHLTDPLVQENLNLGAPIDTDMFAA